jgi:hypothetical protein
MICYRSGGHLAMTTAFTSIERGLAPPDAIMAFYYPTDYEDPIWSQPNFPGKYQWTIGYRVQFSGGCSGSSDYRVQCIEPSQSSGRVDGA